MEKTFQLLIRKMGLCFIAVVITATAWAQQRSISGTVTDKTGEPLPGVTVVVKGTTQGTVTNNDGNYSLTNIQEDGTLQFSFVGMLTQEIQVGNQSQINVTLQMDAIGIEEVVAIGYGTVRKIDLTGSVSSIASSDILQIPNTTMTEILQGRAAGVHVSSGDAAPGGGINIRIRGTSTITGSTEPLYLIDGFPVNSDNDDLNVSGGYNEGNIEGHVSHKVKPNALSFINPKDIESIEILKDAAATAIYGSRGANGVVLITTKRGKTGKPIINVNFSRGIQTIIKKIETYDGPTWAANLTEAEINNGLSPGAVIYNGSDEYHPLPENAETHNWQDLIYRTAPVNDLSMSFTGGNENTKYLLSGRYFDQDGIMIESGFKEMQTRLNLDQSIGKLLSVRTNLLLSHGINDKVPAGAGFNYNAVTSALGYSPAINPDWFDEERGLWYTDSKTAGPGVYTNPVRLLEGIHDQIATNRLLANAVADLNLLQSLKLTASYGIDYSDAVRKTYIERTLTFNGSPAPKGDAAINNKGSVRTNANVYLSWNENFGDHSFDAVGGAEMIEQTISYLNTSIRNFPNDDFKTDNLGAGEGETRGLSNGKNKWQTLGFFGRLNYNYKSKYYASFNARRDGSSVFGASNKWALFPSFALAWRPSEEDFIKQLGVFSNLKIRASIGQTGNGNLSPYSSVGLWSISPNAYSYNNQIVNRAVLSRISNPSLKWETTTQYNIGLDAGILQNRVRFTFDYYVKNTDDLILAVVIPKSTGYQSSIQNIGSLQNRGLEFSADYAVLEGKFKWDLSANMSMFRVEATDIGEGYNVDVNTGESYVEVATWPRDGGPRLYVGQPAGQVYGYVIEGVFRDQQQADNWPVNHGSN